LGEILKRGDFSPISTYIFPVTLNTSTALPIEKEKNMTDRAKFEQMLEYLINEEKEKAQELFHEIVVEKSREIYEGLLEDELEDLEVSEGSDEEVDESTDEEIEEGQDEEVDENFGFAEADDEMEADPTDDMMGDVEAGDDMGDEEGGEDEFGGEEGGEEPVTQDDLESALDDLRAEFEAMLDGEEGGEEEEGEEKEESFVREYVEKVSAGHGAEKKGSGESNVNSKSPVAGKNDMGGTTGNIAKGGEGGGKEAGLSSNQPKDMNTGNVNTPGSKNATKMSSVSKGHGAEKKGAGEQAANTKSTIGS